MIRGGDSLAWPTDEYKGLQDLQEVAKEAGAYSRGRNGRTEGDWWSGKVCGWNGACVYI